MEYFLGMLLPFLLAVFVTFCYYLEHKRMVDTLVELQSKSQMERYELYNRMQTPDPARAVALRETIRPKGSVDPDEIEVEFPTGPVILRK